MSRNTQYRPIKGYIFAKYKTNRAKRHRVTEGVGKCIFDLCDLDVMLVYIQEEIKALIKGSSSAVDAVRRTMEKLFTEEELQNSSLMVRATNKKYQIKEALNVECRTMIESKFIQDLLQHQNKCRGFRYILFLKIMTQSREQIKILN